MPPAVAQIDNDLTFQIAPAALGDITIRPVNDTTSGIPLDASFYVDTEIEMSEAELAKRLSVLSGETFQLTKQKEPQEFLLQFDNPLEPDKIYRLQYIEDTKTPLSFAFQTVSSFRVTATTPAPDAYGVPLDAGIEMTFSKELDGDIADYFTITPAVSGKWIQNGQTYIFSGTPLMPGTQYTVKLKKELTSTDNETLKEDLTFTFDTDWGEYEGVNIYGDIYETFLPTDEVFVELFASKAFENNTYTVNVSSFGNADNFIRYGAQKNNGTNTSSTKPLTTFDTKLFVRENEDYGAQTFIRLDETLPEGYYLIQIQTQSGGKPVILEKLIQVNAVSVYAFAKNGNTYFWLHDTTTGKPAANATVTVADQTTKTNQDGVASCAADPSNHTIITIKANDRPTFVYQMPTLGQQERPETQRYYTYLYTDRSVYRNADTVQVFGVVRQRWAQYPIPKEATFVLKIADVIQQPIQLEKDGTFTAKIPVAFLENYQSLTLCMNEDTVLQTTSLNFYNYVNAVYQISIETDKQVYTTAETVNVRISVTTYDGTPAEGVHLNVGAFEKETSLVTDANGMAFAQIPASSLGYDNAYQPYRTYLPCHITSAESQVQTAEAPIFLLPSDVDIKTESPQEGQLEVKSNKVDAARLEQRLVDPDLSPYDLKPEDYTGTPTNVSLTLEIFKQTTVKTLISERYDFIQKKTVSSYDYSMTETTDGTRNVTTVNGTVLLTDLPISNDPLVDYYGILHCVDTSGYKFEQRVSWYTSMPYSNSPISQNKYSFTIGDMSEDNIFSVNESKNIRVQDGNNHFVAEGTAFALVASGNGVTPIVSKASGIPFTFAEADIPNATVFGAYFDGTHVYGITYPLTLQYRSDDRALRVDVAFDQ